MAGAGPLAAATVQKAYQLLGKVMGAAVDAGMVMHLTGSGDPEAFVFTALRVGRYG